MIFAVLFSLAITAQVGEDRRDCRDDNGSDRCAETAQAAVRSKFGVASIEEEAAAGVESYRAFYVDGYGRDMPVVSFERRPGSEPMVTVYGVEGRRLSAPVSSEAWNRVRSEGRFADRALELPATLPLAAGARAPIPPICLHGWVTTAEISNSSPEGRTIVPVRRRTEGACGGALTTRFAFSLAEEAVNAVAPCGLLDKAVQRNNITILETCLGLTGDRFAAAELLNQVRTGMPRQNLDLLDAGTWRAYLGTNGSPELTWDGERVKTDRGRDNKVAEFVVAKLVEAPSTRVEPKRFEGLSGREAVVEGVVSYTIGEGQTAERREAPYRQTWIWDPNLSDWMLATWTVEPFAPVS